MIGQTILHYKILDQLSAQGMADVYLAEDAKLHRKVVMKFLPVECNRNPELRVRWTQLHICSHSNCLKIAHAMLSFTILMKANFI